MPATARGSARLALLAGLGVAVWLLRVELPPRLPGDLGPALAAGLDGGAALGAAVACALAARRAGNRRARVAWSAQSFAAASWLLAPLTWLAASGTLGWLSSADLGRAAYVVGVATGFWLTSRARDVRSRLRLVLDGTVGAASAMVVVWAVLLDPVLRAHDAEPGRLVPSLTFPIAALTGLIFYAFLAVTEFRPGRRRMPTLFVLAQVGVFVADLRFAELSIVAGEPARWVDSGGWTLGFALTAGAALSYRGTTPRRSVAPTTWWVSYTPYLLLVPAGATILAQWAWRGRVPATELVAAGLIVAVLLSRQVLILAENRSLVARLLASEQRLRHLALHDPLTGLGNRALLLSRLDEALGGPDGSGGPPADLALIFCDLDDFKPVNDTYGHHAGDELLIQVGRRMRAALRPDDTIVRLGGDEYAAMMACPPATALAVADRLWEALQQPYPVAGHEVRVSGSIGLTVVDPGRRTSADEVLREADDAMYAVKRAGKNGVHVFAPGDVVPPRPVPRPPAPGDATAGATAPARR